MMAIEIERKFLVCNDSWRKDEHGQPVMGTVFRQGYMADGDATVRVRIQGAQARLTIKGKTQGMSRLEFEYEIPMGDAIQMLDSLCKKPLVEKTRYVRQENGLTWEIDVFEGENRGLVLAEVELESEDQQVQLPEWVGEEVTHDRRYYNVNLSTMPYTQW